jgi:hypothetical protein
VWLTEPLVKSQEFTQSERELPAATWIWVCDPVVEIATQTPGDVPSYMPGEHPFENEFGDRYHLPPIATRGGAETMYPEFQEKLKAAMPQFEKERAARLAAAEAAKAKQKAAASQQRRAQ